MPIIFACPGCQKKFQLADDRAGKMVRCSACERVSQVPAESPVASPQTSPSSIAPVSASPLPARANSLPARAPRPSRFRLLFGVSTFFFVLGYLCFAVAAFAAWHASSTVSELEEDPMGKFRKAHPRPVMPQFNPQPDLSPEQFERARERIMEPYHEQMRDWDLLERSARKAVERREQSAMTATVWFFAAAVLQALFQFLGLALVLLCIFLMWQVVQDGHARTSPGMAVGLLFVPFYNIIWIFTALHGWTRDANSVIARHGVEATPLSSWLSVANCVCLVGGAIPGLNFLLMIPAGIIWLAWFNAATEVAARIAAKARGESFE